MRILVSNDDGVHAKGIVTLAEALKKIAMVDVVAPDRNRSGASNSLTLNAPLHLKIMENGYVSVEGTPTDCVHVAITGLLETPPDMVVTGINAGANMGDDVWYSGTVAAAMEGRFLGLPSIAMSLASERQEHYDTAARVACELIQHILKEPLPSATILNVNVPDVAYEELRGFEITRLGTRHCAEPTIKQIDPRGHTIYWVGPAGTEQDAGVGTDFYAIHHNIVSITPLRIDLTHFEAFDVLSSWVGRLKKK
ncbi:MAG: 5'/3'-nucleotidase SurE [Gammaproteobacteria bacterium RIFCSPLOWO2_02_FULL_42_14]|nr:MAG: 5'/3'-nucleotidase SurE [Gammaproteobacteria bacterium RIFCSPHIGHO2_02_FULL_42_43]OGT28774.1 MAG: 5'/3'-nucleotidase SurE [Gammaproteobacteria bacterium RIFCSPHIGHO2_01_FULL_42_8]OGT52044.1 MAG: 5'/3'-nucleotidase SurE [Gammaproteobacteria bacterium RIFCSPHIGHO2_12_FULL_41_25]OGT61354.1 MAG: 5'/3'-nucleotidase SurE [Gammaproteobacteria bacterium RIFCSPLOWO2_02_FULL_42_14]OGT87282.1 MAG: 5'/3'-nucleotidase SurE [Gammaproteobacteria bacterium RIFCSPLOWO2_12_FULL_42_18]